MVLCAVQWPVTRIGLTTLRWTQTTCYEPDHSTWAFTMMTQFRKQDKVRPSFCEVETYFQSFSPFLLDRKQENRTRTVQRSVPERRWVARLLLRWFHSLSVELRQIQVHHTHDRPPKRRQRCEIFTRCQVKCHRLFAFSIFFTTALFKFD